MKTALIRNETKKKYNAFFDINVLKYMLLLYFALFVSVCMVYIQEVNFHLIFIALYILFAMFIVKFEPVHPIVWSLPFIYLYHYSVIILDKMGIREATHQKDILIIGWIAICTTSLCLLLICQKGNIKLNYMKSDINSTSAKIIFSFLLLLVLAHNVIFLGSGISSKSEASLSGLNRLQFAHLWLLLAYSIIIIKAFFVTKTKPWRLILFMFFITLFSTLNLGQRDIFLTYLVLTVCIIYIRYHPPKALIYLVGLLVISLIPILGEMKNIFTRGNVIISKDSLLTDLLSGEFLSAGRNIETLLSYQNSWDFFFGKTLIWDTIRTFVPGIMYSTQNSVGWFNNTFYSSKVADGLGMGFSLSGEGYINFGLIGVSLWFFIFSLFIGILYNRCRNGIISVIIYTSTIPIFIYALRADFSNLFSPIFKTIIIPIVCIYIINEVIKKFYIKERNYT